MNFLSFSIQGNKSDIACKQFALFKNALAVETFVRSLLASERNLYEICLYSGNRSIRNYAVKLFIDVDITGEEWNEDKKQDYVESIYYKFHVLESLYGIDYSHRNIRVVDSSGIIEKPSGQVYKTSFHVIFNEVHFANIDKMKIFIDKYFPKLFSLLMLMVLCTNTIKSFGYPTRMKSSIVVCR